MIDELMEEKYCPKCKDTKSLEEFYCNKSNRDGLQGECKTCLKARVEKWRQENPERYKACGKKWRQENPEKVRARSKRWRRRNPEKCKADSLRYRLKNPDHATNNNLMIKYGITLDEYNELFAAQGGKCVLCGRVLVKRKNRHPVDHDHSLSGPESVRGIIHGQCNGLVGVAENSPELFDKVKEYLENWKLVGHY